jgi:hypothetical protein
MPITGSIHNSVFHKLTDPLASGVLLLRLLGKHGFVQLLNDISVQKRLISNKPFKGTIIFIRRTDNKGYVDILGHRWSIHFEQIG